MFFLCFFYFSMFFLYFFNFMFLLSLKQKTYKITNIMHFSWSKTPFPRHSECFVAVLLTYSCQKSCRILDVFRPPKFLGAGHPKVIPILSPL